MANVFQSVIAPAGNGAGAPVDFSTFGGEKTIIVSGTWTLLPTINLEFNNATNSADGSWAPLVTFQGRGIAVKDVACKWIRARVSNFRGGQAPVINIAGNDNGTTLVELVVPAGNGVGAATDVSALGAFKTLQIGGAFSGVVIVEVSADGITEWATAFSSNNQGSQNAELVANWARVVRSGVTTIGGTPVVALGGTEPGGGGGGGSVGPGTVNTLAKFTGANAVGDSTITDDGTVVEFTSLGAPDPQQGGFNSATRMAGPLALYLATGPADNLDSGLAVFYTGGPHAGELINANFFMSASIDCNANPATQVGGIQIAVAPVKIGAGSLTVIGIESEASGGDNNYSWLSNNGFMSQAGGAFVGLAVEGATFGAGATAVAKETVINSRVGINTDFTGPSGQHGALTVIGSGVGLTAFDGGVQSFQLSTFDVTTGPTQSLAGFFSNAATKSAGVNTLTNIAVSANAVGGDTNFSWLSLNGFMRQDGGALFGTTVEGFTVSAFGASAPIGEALFDCPLRVTNTQEVDLGNNVRPFFIPGSAVLNAQIGIGLNTSTGSQLNLKNVVPGSATAGINLALDTTVTAGIRGGLLLYRGAGGGLAGNNAGFVLSAGGEFLVGILANESALFNLLGDMCFGADGVGFTMGAKLPANGQFIAKSLQIGNPVTKVGPAFITGVGAPAAAGVLIGDEYIDTTGVLGAIKYIWNGAVWTPFA